MWAAVWLSATAVLALWEGGRSALLSIKVSEQSVIIGLYVRAMYASTLAFVALAVVLLVNQAAPVIVYKSF